MGHDLLLLRRRPSCLDNTGRILLVRLIDSGNWATIGGAVEPGESPREGAVREVAEEAGVAVELGAILGVFGGPEYNVTYPNGDGSAYVVTAFDATVVDGVPRPDGDETSEVGWFRPDELPLGEMGELTRALVRDLELTGVQITPVSHSSYSSPAFRGPANQLSPIFQPSCLALHLLPTTGP